jgi:hypothetical protein
MSIINAWMGWLNTFGIAPFCVAMVVFLGGYALLRRRLVPGSLGQRRALAIGCLMAGLLVGNMMSHVSDREKPAHSKTVETVVRVHHSYSIFPRLLAGICLGLFMFAVGRNCLKNRFRYSSYGVPAIGLLSGLLFFFIGPEMSLPAAIIFGGLLWFLSRLILKSTGMANPG